MKILVVGGTGLIGGDVALRLAAMGQEVTIAARKASAAGTPMAALPLLNGDYAAGDFTREMLEPFDALIFAATNDIRHVRDPSHEAAHLERTNVEGVPRFFAQARAAGIKRAVLVGSFYPWAVPHAIDTSPYVRSRLLADEGVRALSRPGFEVCSVNPPFVLGRIDGLRVPNLAIQANYALGRLQGIPVFAIAGGINVMSSSALSDALIGALARGEPGKAYLVGDENLSFQDYFTLFFRAAGNSMAIPVEDREHPLLPDAMLYAGRGAEIFYEPDPVETALLGYRRGDLVKTIAAIVEQYR
jgi:nucleoside-diphosphate-sugar epimerase